MDKCKKCELKQLCKDAPSDFSCDDVKQLAKLEQEGE